MQSIILKDFEIANNKPLTLIAGPCQLESRDLSMRVAEHLAVMANKLGLNFIFKASFDKANRTSIGGERGMGLEQALPIFAEIKSQFACPVLTDVHLPEQCALVAEVIDVLQIPALLCRQTDLLLAAGNTGRIINVKKGQFLAPWDMKHVAQKVASTGNKNIMLTERGVTFGYNRLVTDMRSLVVMAETGYPVVFDATHSVQEPGGEGRSSGGQRHMVKSLARAAVAVGVAALFLETHPNPDEAFSDGPCMVKLGDMAGFMRDIMLLDATAKSLA
jgi:2-dehydro-3-deoxyphosphooctonate aldolase (KDO 8-P synthase)